MENTKKSERKKEPHPLGTIVKMIKPYDGWRSLTVGIVYAYAKTGSDVLHYTLLFFDDRSWNVTGGCLKQVKLTRGKYV